MPLRSLVELKNVNPPFDIQRTAFSLDAAARFVCHTWDEVIKAQTGRPFDIVVIGSGMYGGYCASKLFSIANLLQTEGKMRAEDKPRILVLEAGPYLLDEHVHNKTRAFFDIQQSVLSMPALSNAPTLVPHHRCVGGKSLFWGGWTPPLIEADLQQWPEEVVRYMSEPDGYKFVLDEIGTTPCIDFIGDKLTERMIELTRGIIASGKVPTLKKVEEAPIAVQAAAPSSGFLSTDKFSSLPLLFDAIRDDSVRAGLTNDSAKRLFLVPNAEVLRLDYVNGFVTGLTVALTELSSDADRPELSRRVVRLDLPQSALVVLAANSISSTRLALNSFRRPATLGPELMGRNLMVHVRGNWKWLIHRSVLEKVGGPILDQLRTSAWHVSGETDALNDAGLRGRFHFQSYAAGLLENPPFIEDPTVIEPDEPFLADFVKKQPDVAVENVLRAADVDHYLYRMAPNFDELQPLLSSLLPDWVSVALRTTGETFGNRNAPVGSPGTSWIDVNPFGGVGDDVYSDPVTGEEIRIPKAFVNFVESEDDQNVRAAQTAAADGYIAALAGVDVHDVEDRRCRANDDPRKHEPIDGKLIFESGGEDPVGTTYHECGTLWMGTDPLVSVTDVNGRFHHVANGACIDQALFPTAGSANPVPTGLTLARIVTRRLLDRFVDTPDTPVRAGFRNLYDGTFSNWKISGDGVGSDRFLPITVGGSQILEVGQSGPGPLGIIWFDEEFDNFELQLDWKAFSVDANSGVFLRMPRPPATLNNAFYENSLEVQIDERGFDHENNVFGSPLHKTGAVYKRIPSTQWAAKAVVPRFGPRPGFWNRYVIRADGPLIQVLLNGRYTVNGHLAAGSPTKGFIGLQCHTDVVQFRNIRVKQLSG